MLGYGSKCFSFGVMLQNVYAVKWQGYVTVTPTDYHMW
jgi:hypothetical protein